MEHVLEARHLKKVFTEKQEQRVVLDDVSFFVDAGECLGLVGRSGCGKSTAARIIARLLPADSGQIFLCGGEITHARGGGLSSVYRRMQMIFQMPEDSFDPRKTLGWSIAEPMRNMGKGMRLEKRQIEERVESLLMEVGLHASYADRYPHEVSGGECQRAAIARAVSISPRLLICDEATSALDVTIQAQVIDLLRKLCKKQGIACLFITHNLALLPRIADRVMVMHGGKIVEEGTPERLLRNAVSPYTKELIEADLFRLPLKEMVQ